jgi:hypothetical protein
VTFITANCLPPPQEKKEEEGEQTATAAITDGSSAKEREKRDKATAVAEFDRRKMELSDGIDKLRSLKAGGR